MDPSRSLSTRRVWYAFVAALSIAIGFLGAVWIYKHWRDSDFQFVLIHGIVDCLPFLSAIVFALWAEEVNRMSGWWKLAILCAGLLVTGLLVKKDYLDLQASRKDQQDAVQTAVRDANKHTDQKIQDVQNQVQGVGTTVNLRMDSLSKALLKRDSDITGAIGKVGIAPSRYAQLKFGIFDSGLATQNTTQVLIPDPDGAYALDFTAINISDTPATGIDVWVYICEQCSFVGNPVGFDKPEGMKELERHRYIPLLNPGVALEKTTIKFKISGGPFSYTDTFFEYSCSSCGKKSPPQSIRGFLTKPMPQPSLPLN